MSSGIDADQRVPADLPERGQSYDLARGRRPAGWRGSLPTGLGQQIGPLTVRPEPDRELVSISARS